MGTIKSHRDQTFQVNTLNVGSAAQNLDLGANTVVKVAKGSLSATAGNGGLFAWANPEGETIFILALVVDVTTQATGAALGDFGVAANGSTSSDTLIDGGNIGAAPITLSNHADQGTNGMAGDLCTSTQYVTGTASADPAGLVGSYYIVYCLDA